jgi:hypothetical protein
VGRYAAIAVAVIASIAAASLVNTALQAPDVVDLTVENDTAFHVHVDGIGWAQRGTTTFLEVIDEGDDWTVHLDYGGVDAGTAEVVDRRLVIPTSAEDALRTGGRVPQP